MSRPLRLLDLAGRMTLSLLCLTLPIALGAAVVLFRFVTGSCT